jgi:pimeloyl-ACP methyl ester carboxylesterase
LRARKRTAAVGDVEMPYYDAGSGDVVLLLHGFAANKETWLPMALALSRQRRILIPDIPGYGAATKVPPSRASALAQARAVLGFLDTLGVDRAHLVGNSMGGGISLKVAREAPERVRSMTLICSTGPKSVKSELDEALDRGENLLLPERVEQAEELLRFVAGKQRWIPRPLARYLISNHVNDRERLLRMFDGWHDSDETEGLPEDLEAIEVPTLVIHGECDRVINNATGRELAERIPNAELVLMSGIGHTPQLEVARKTARTVERFIDAL